MRGHAYDVDFFRNMYSVYAALHRLLPTAGRPRALVSDVTLRFGAHEVLVDMPYVAGRHVTEDEFTSSVVVERVAEAVVWLARNKVVYRDVRDANVLIDAGGDVVLVDYDDCFLVDDAVTDFALYAAALQGRAAPATMASAHVATFSSALLDGTLPAMKAALEVAFREAARLGGAGGAGSP